jgi:hypothetical protein
VVIATDREPVSAVEITIPADSLGTSGLIENLGKLLGGAARRLQAELLDHGLAPELAS